MPSKILKSYPLSINRHSVPGIRPLKRISEEPMVFAADYKFAVNNGGDLTREVVAQLARDNFLDKSPDPEFPHLRIHTRVHMLMPGMYPAIPGWHCDGVPRGDYTAQPDMDKASDRGLHASVFISTTPGLAPTEFLKGDVSVNFDPEDVWGTVDSGLRSAQIIPSVPYDGQIVAFTGQTLHRCTAAVTRGWRFFLRASWGDQPAKNKIRNQVQVYTSAGGW